MNTIAPTDRLSALLVASGRPVEVVERRSPGGAATGEWIAVPDLEGGAIEQQPDDDQPPHLSGWINCRWGDAPVGGCWITDGNLAPYEYSDMTGGCAANAAYFRALGVAADEKDEEELRERVMIASRRECRRILDAEAAA